MAGERGSATIVLMVGLMAAAAVFSAVVGIGRVAAARVQVSAAADLAALAGATAADCGLAERVARANGARLRDCVIDGVDLIVTAESTLTILPGRDAVIAASARAGPP